MNVETIESTSDHSISIWENFGIIVWRKESTTRAIRLCIDVIKDHSNKIDKDILLVTIIEPQSILPELSVRVSIIDALKDAQGIVSRSGVFVVGEGFKAISKRAVISGILAFTKLDYPHKVFRNVGTLSKFLLGSDTKIPVHILMRAIDIARHAKIDT
jgi:hypothetical protein